MEHVYILQCFLAPMFGNKCGKSIEIKYKEDIKLVNSYYFFRNYQYTEQKLSISRYRLESGLQSGRDPEDVPDYMGH